MSDPTGRSSSAQLVTAVLLVAMMVGAGLVLVQSRGGDGEDDLVAGGGEIFLEPASLAGSDPFTESVAGEVVAPEPVPAPSTTAAPAAREQVVAASGTEPGLYGGTRDESRCDVAQLIRFMESDAVKLRAFAAVAGIEPAGIRSFLESLTPVQLRVDTRVTNHGFRDGRATPRQAVLQAGTAVLVDATGLPRVKCGCGNPLAAPQMATSPPTYTGSGWSAFSPAATVVVEPGPAVEVLVVVDPIDGTAFARPVGTRGDADTDPPEGTVVSDPFGGEPATSPTAAPAAPTDEVTLTGAVHLLEDLSDATDVGDLEQIGSDLVVSIAADGRATGSFSMTMRITQANGCVYTSRLNGDLDGTLTGTVLVGTWQGALAESVEAGDCAGTTLVNEGWEGTWDGVYESTAGETTGSISAGGDPLLGFDATR